MAPEPGPRGGQLAGSTNQERSVFGLSQMMRLEEMTSLDAGLGRCSANG